MGITSMGVALLKGKGSMTTMRKEIYLRCLKKTKKKLMAWHIDAVMNLWYVKPCSTCWFDDFPFDIYTSLRDGMMWLE
jgi:hypothetical protein